MLHFETILDIRVMTRARFYFAEEGTWQIELCIDIDEDLYSVAVVLSSRTFIAIASSDLGRSTVSQI